ncbi:MAG: hypothetical protein P4M11_02635 [Candidatus Pacebacteria bacterium]|nr:hypothetical protein [Candidatus Paceibacterota bacterium]
MINPYTLSVSNITIPKDILSMHRFQFDYMLVFAFICSILTMSINIIYIVASPEYDDLSAHDIAVVLSLCVAAAVVCSGGWVLSAKFHVCFPGFAMLVTAVGCEFLLEQIMQNKQSYSDNAAMYRSN